MSFSHDNSHIAAEARKISDDLAHSNFTGAHNELVKELHSHPHDFNKLVAATNSDLAHHHHHGMRVTHDGSHHVGQIDFGKHHIYKAHEPAGDKPTEAKSHHAGADKVSASGDDGEARTGKRWMAQHEALVKQAHETKADTVFYGDSITAGMPVTKGKFGINSDKTENLKYRLMHGEADLGTQPKNAVLHIGINDLGHKSPETIANDIYADAKLLHEKLPNSKVLVVGLMSRPGFDSQISQINSMLKEKIAASGVPEMKFTDVRDSMKGFYRDGIHPTYPDKHNPHKPYGYAQFMASIKNALN